jgi:transposase-like protein
MTGKEFSKWMDESGIALTEAALHFGVSEQTIYNWRSTRGIADSKAAWVRGRMRDYIHQRGVAQLPERLVLEVPPPQFDRWCRAALREHKIPRDWAIDTLDRIAAEEGVEAGEQGAVTDRTGSDAAPDPIESTTLGLIAEEPGKYHAGPATPGDSSPSARTKDSA